MPKVDSQEGLYALGEIEHEGVTDTRMNATALMQVASLAVSACEDGTFVGLPQEGIDSSKVSPTEEILELGDAYYKTNVGRKGSLADAMAAQRPVETTKRADFM